MEIREKAKQLGAVFRPKRIVEASRASLAERKHGHAVQRPVHQAVSPSRALMAATTK